MKLHPRHLRISPAMVVAMLALFAALTGTAVATTSALITGKQIKNGSITGADVKNKSLTPRDFRGSVRGPQGPPGPQGAAGALGPQVAPLIWHVITGAVPEGCSGTYANPGAAPGHLCVFVHENMHMSPP